MILDAGVAAELRAVISQMKNAEGVGRDAASILNFMDGICKDYDQGAASVALLVASVFVKKASQVSPDHVDVRTAQLLGQALLFAAGTMFQASEIPT